MRTTMSIVYSVSAAVGLFLGSANAWAQIPPETDVSSREFIRAWLVCGPFPNPLADGVTEYRHDKTTLGFYTDYLTTAGGESGIQPQEGLAVAAPGGVSYSWKAYASPSDYIDLCEVFSDNQDGKVAYAACRIVAPADQEVLLGIGSNDGVKVWINGAVCWENHCSRGADKDQDFIAAPLKQGANLLLLKVDQGSGKWGFYVRIVDRDQAIDQLAAEEHPRIEATYAKEGTALSVWMGKTSKYRILKPLPEVKTTLHKPDGEIVGAVSCPLGEAALLDAATLTPGPYWIRCTTHLLNNRKAEDKVFYLHGDSPLTLYTYAENAQPFSCKMELLEDRRSTCSEKSAHYDALSFRPEFVPVEGGLIEVAQGKWQLQRTDVSPFWLRVLLEVPGLGRQWFMVNHAPLVIMPGETMELDVLKETLTTLHMQLSNYIESAAPISEWLFQNLRARLSSTAARFSGKQPADIYQSLRTLSSLKSLLTTQGSLTAWYAPSIEKVGRNETPPSIEAGIAQVTLARNEYEAFQLVLTANEPLAGVSVSITPPKTEDGLVLDAKNIAVNLVEYVKVTAPSDYYGTKGLWPDPLPPLSGPFDLPANANQPLWITVYAPGNQFPGEYTGAVTLQAGGNPLCEVPFSVLVNSVTLPPETHTASAYGVSPDFSWHGPLNLNQKMQVFDLYMQLCATHRISPYSPHALAPFTIAFQGTPPHPVIDFNHFEQIMTRYLNEFHFTSFNLGGLPGDLAGHPRFSPEYNLLFKAAYQQVEQHLREKGWLDKAYWYWVDEPPPSQYEEVKQGMELLKEACPNIRRLLTCNQEQAPVPYFYDSVNLWVPILDRYEPVRAADRQDCGENVWWYVCTGPKAPYANNFIDHPAINHRIRYWQMDKYDVDGCLFWSATYWAQNPWEQAMAISDSGGPWGNGDGRLLYPPRRAKPAEVVLEPPVVSIRFENLRDGLEDREYLMLLEQVMARRTSLRGNVRAVLTRARATLCSSLTCYEQNPILFHLIRHEVMQEAIALCSND